VNPAQVPACEPLEKRLELLRRLASVLEEAQTAVLHSDLKAIACQTARQQELCDALRESALQNSPSPRPVLKSSENSDWRTRREALLLELEDVENRVRYLNRVHAGLLRRAYRSLAILSRALSSSSITYSPSQPGEMLTDRQR
jgi:hypothetical protein